MAKITLNNGLSVSFIRLRIDLVKGHVIDYLRHAERRHTFRTKAAPETPSQYISSKEPES